MSHALVNTVIVAVLALLVVLALLGHRANRRHDAMNAEIDAGRAPAVRPTSQVIWGHTATGPEQSVLHLNEEVDLDVVA